MIVPASRNLGKYEIRQKLGRGGMADVYLAQDTELGAEVALKLIEHAPDQDTRDFIEAERRGAELQAHLAAVDPRVARVYDAGDLDGFFFVAMEYVEGQDLSELMRRGPLAVEFAADVAIAVAQTLENAHNLQVAIDGKDFQGIVHGDIKPKNIRIDPRGEVRVLDFGIAKALSLSRRLTRNEFGSVPYASPERLDSGDVDASSDLWSLGVMLYEMATGLQPYQGGSTELLERKIRSGIAPPPAPDPCPEPLRRVLMKALSPDPAVRYRTAREFSADLAAFRRGEPVLAAAEDLDATRRTARRTEPDDATRRTVKTNGGPGDETRPTGGGVRFGGRPAPPAAEWPHVHRVKPRRSLAGSVVRGIGLLFLATIVYITWSLVSDYRLYQRGQELQRQVDTEQITDLNTLWSKWTELSRGRASSWLLRGPRKAVKQKLVDAADRVIVSYRNDVKQSREGDWSRARGWLSHALEMEPDKEIRGKLRLCEGHLERIDGTTHEDVNRLNAAAQDFLEAQKLLPNAPDPELGLARLYVYGFKDIDKARDALEEARKRGYEPGNRDKAQLADGYRERADRLWWDSRNVRGLPQEKDQISRAEQDYQSALDLYQSIAPYGSSILQIVRIQFDLASVRERLQQLDQNPGGAQQ